MNYPKLSEIAALSNVDFPQASSAIRTLIRSAYGMNHWALTPRDRAHRATLNKLANTIDQMALIGDLDVYELGFNCPGQLRRYHSSLSESMPIAYQRGINKEDLRVLDEAHERLWHVMNEVTFMFDGLS